MYHFVWILSYARLVYVLGDVLCLQEKAFSWWFFSFYGPSHSDVFLSYFKIATFMYHHKLGQTMHTELI